MFIKDLQNSRSYIGPNYDNYIKALEELETGVILVRNFVGDVDNYFDRSIYVNSSELEITKFKKYLVSWDSYFISIADTVRSKSKDTSSKIGAVIVGPEKQIISTGFNGFPRGIDEVTDMSRWERPVKYQFVEHAEPDP